MSKAPSMTRRRLLISGAGVFAAVASATYAPLLVGDNFEGFVASKLGIGEGLASEMLDLAREQYGDLSYDARAARFALAFRSPLGSIVPASAQRDAAQALLGPMFGKEAAALAFSEDDGAPIDTPCSGLIPVA